MQNVLSERETEESLGEIRILVADDHAVVRAGIKQILSEHHELVVAAEACTGREVLARLREQPFDLVILDISLPDRSGLDVLKQIKSLYPKLAVLVLTMHAEAQYAVRVLKAGAAGYLNKESAPQELVTAITKLARGGRYVSSSLAEKLVFDIGLDQTKPPHEYLSDREFEVLLMIAKGMRIKEIGEKLCLSVKTVSSHRARILTKMRMRTNAELIQYCLTTNLI